MPKAGWAGVIKRKITAPKGHTHDKMYARSDRNFAAHVPVTERQSVSHGELRGVLHALLHSKPGERLVVVLDLLYVYRGIVHWLPKWRRHGWRTLSGEVGHRDLWE